MLAKPRTCSRVCELLLIARARAFTRSEVDELGDLVSGVAAAGVVAA